MGFLDRLSPSHYVKQLARKQNAFGPNGKATLEGVLEYGKGRKATGRLIYGRQGRGGELIATTSRLKSSYQGLRMPGATRTEVGRVSDPLNETIADIAAAFPNDQVVLSAVDMFKGSRDGFDQVLDTPKLYAALKVLVPYEKKLKEARARNTQPKSVRFDESRPALRKRQLDRARALVRQRTLPAIPRALASDPSNAAQPVGEAAVQKPQRTVVPPVPVSSASHVVQSSGENVEPKLDIRARVAAGGMRFKRGDMLDAQRLLSSVFNDPELLVDPLRVLLIAAREHAAKRTETIPNPWDLNKVTGIDEGLEVLLKTPLFVLIKAQAPVLFEKICDHYDQLP